MKKYQSKISSISNEDKLFTRTKKIMEFRFLPDDNFLILTEEVRVTDVTAADIGDSTTAMEAAISARVLLPGEESILPPLTFFPKIEQDSFVSKIIVPM